MTATFEQRFQKLKEGPSSFEDRFNRLSQKETEEESGSNEEGRLSFEDRFNRLAQQSNASVKQSNAPTQQEESFYDQFIPKPYSSEKTSPEKSFRKNTLDIYRPEEKTVEQLEKMTVGERMQYAQELQNLRELQSGTGVGKGILSGLTLSASEHIPGLRPDEDDLMVELGETLGSYLPISKIYSFIGKPLVSFAAKSPVARQGLESLARMTGFGLTGAAYKAGKEVVQGEVPEPKELLKEGATWAAIDAALQSLGLGVAFSNSVKRIAEHEGITAKEVLSKLWDSTKNYVKLKLGRPVKGEILPEDVEVLMGKAKAAETGGLKEAEIEVAPKAEAVKPTEKFTPEAKNQEQPFEVTEKVEQGRVTPEGQVNFTTSKGSTYQVNEDGSTTRNKATRPEHPGEEGLQQQSEKTWYVTPEDSLKLGEIQTQGGANKKIVELPNGQLGVQYTTGKHAGKIESRTLSDFSKEPKEGMIPVESWDSGERIHFGNAITKVEKAIPTAKEEPKALKGIPKEVYRGYGRKEKGSVYSELQEPILGEGKYFAFSEAEASEFGPKIERKEIDLKNPLVIKNDQEWRAFTNRSGLEFPNPISMSKEDTLANVKKLRDTLDKEGYDGAVIWFPETAGDVNATGESIKTLRKVFGVPQVFETPKKGLQENAVHEKAAPKPKTPEIIDERPILKEIIDLKEELSHTKGSTKAIRDRKFDLSQMIKQKVGELGDIRRRNKALESPYEKKFTETDLTTKGLKKQKEYIIDKVDEALVNPPDTNQVIIDVPNDGLFKINNDRRSLEQFRTRVEKQWPKGTKTKAPEPKAKTEQQPKETAPENPSVIPKTMDEIEQNILKFGNSPKDMQPMPVDQILDSVYKAKYHDIRNAVEAIETIKGKKAAEIPYDKLDDLKKELVKYIKTTHPDELSTTNNDFRRSVQQEFDKRQRILENKIKGYNNARKALEKREGQGIVLSSKVTSELPKKPTQVPPPQTKRLQPVMGKKQAVARSKIIQLFRDAFTDPIRLGKISQRNAAGIHKLWPKVTRLLKDNDVETAAHEIGHNLHTTLYGGNAKTSQEQVKNIEEALKPYLNELKPLAHYEPFGMEGFAEFTRLYVTNPEVALDLAPDFYAKFEADLEAQYPELKNALLEARDYYDQYLQGTPQSRIRAQTNYGSDKGKLANIIDSLKEGFNLDNLKTQFLDDIYPAKRLVAEAFGIPISEVENLKDERNLYRSLRVLKGAVGKGDVFVMHETFNAKTLDKINGSLKDILKKLPNEESYREFNDYLIARRALEKTSQNIETGINVGDALAVEQDLRPKYGKLAQELDKYNDALLNYAKDAGLLSPQQYKMIKDNNVLYAPFQRVMEPEKGGAASGGGRLQAGKPIKRMKGSTRDIIAPIESIIKNTYSIIINSEKNLSGQVLAKIAQMKDVGGYVEHVPTPIKLKGKVEGEQVAKELAKRFEREGLSDLIEYDQNGKPVLREDIAEAIPEVFLRFGAGQYPAGENIVTVYFDGKPRYYEVTPELFEMWNKGTAPYTANLLTKILRIPSRTLRAGAILNPRFIQKNAIRDTWGGWLFTKYGKSIKDPTGMFIDTLYSPLAMLGVSAKKGPLYVEWLKSGGGMSTLQSLDRDNVVKKLEEVRHGHKYHVIKWMRQVAEVSEEANRLSEFGRALKVEGNTRLGREIAAFASRDLSVDFAKMGLQVKALNQIIPFFNATIQGGDKLLRSMLNPKDRKDFLPRVLGFIVIPSLIFAWLNKDDDRVKEFYEEEKDFNFITFIGDQAIKIPVPFETGVIAHGLTQRMYNYFANKDPEAFEEFMGSIISAMMPNFIPAFANPFIEAWANKNFFTNARIVPAGKEDLHCQVPIQEQYLKHSSIVRPCYGIHARARYQIKGSISRYHRSLYQLMGWWSRSSDD